MFLFASGRFNTPHCVAVAGQELARYGPLEACFRGDGFRVLAVGDRAVVVEAGPRKIAATGADRIGVEELRTWAEAGAAATEASARWPHSLLAVGNGEAGDVRFVRGEFCPRRFCYVREGRDLLAAPTERAVRIAAGVSGNSRLGKGRALRFHPTMGKCRGEGARRTWVRDAAGSRDYVEAKRRLRELMTEAVASTTSAAPRPLGLMLSGGLDSAILACILAELGERPPALTVSFDPGGRDAPPDATRARLTAGMLGLQHHEIVVGRAEIEPLIRETILRGDTSNRLEVEGHLYLTRACDELQRLGWASCLRGDGLDGLLGSYAMLGTAGSAEERDEMFRKLLNSGYAVGSPYLIGKSFPVPLLAPFVRRSVEEFCLSLPFEFIGQGSGADYVGKRIARDAFAGLLPPEVIEGSKALPTETTGVAALLEELLGPPAARQERHEHVYGELLRESMGERGGGLLSRLGRLLGRFTS